MTVINHDIRSLNGKTIFMPPFKGGQEGWGNLGVPNPYLCDQVARYPTGTIMRDGYRTFVYSYLQVASCGWTISGLTGLGVVSENLPVSVTIVTATGLASTVTGTIAAAAVNQFAGGTLVMYEAGVVGSPQIARIESNTVRTGGNTVFTLSDPVMYTGFSAAATAHVMIDPYSNVRFMHLARPANSFEPLMGFWVAPFDSAGTAADEGDYAWIQTGGPCHVWATTYQGGNSYERAAYHVGTGSLRVGFDAEDHHGAQYCGYLLPATCADPGVSTTGTDVTLTQSVIWLNILN